MRNDSSVECADDKRNAPIAEEVSRFVKGLRKVSASRDRPREPLWSAAGTIVSWMESELVRARLVSASRHRFSFRRQWSDVVKRFADTSSACVLFAAEVSVRLEELLQWEERLPTVSTKNGNGACAECKWVQVGFGQVSMAHAA